MRLGLVGAGIGRSMAPAWFRRAGERLGVDISYDLIELEPGDRGGARRVVEEAPDRGFTGLNVTYPFKECVLDRVDSHDDAVARIGSVNTVSFRSGSAHGSNTDHSGFMHRWRDRWPDAAPGIVTVLGAGGVGRALAFGVADLGADEVRVVDVEVERALRLASDLESWHPGLPVRSGTDADALVDGSDGVVNGTPVGMYIQPGCPVSSDLLVGLRWVFDAVYSPLETPFLSHARIAGVDSMSGFDLFLGQAVDAFACFAGEELDDAVAAALDAEMWEVVEARDAAV